MEPTGDKHTGRQSGKFIFGVIILLAGMALLGLNTGFVPFYFKHILFSWQMILIAIGIIFLLTHDNKTPGLIMLAIGTFFILPRVFVFPFNFYGMLWPIILIIVGLIILIRRGHRPSFHIPGQKTETPVPEAGYIHEESVFTGTRHKFFYQTFRGGYINCVFGSVDLDLSQATLAEGTTELELNIVFGGVNLVVPSDWKLLVRTNSVIGNFTDKRMVIKESADPSKLLIIKGSIVFGGGEIKSY